jgi:hypothetical protein
MLKRLKQAWKRDRLGVLGIGAAIVALVFSVLPVRFIQYELVCENIPAYPEGISIGTYWARWDWITDKADWPTQQWDCFHLYGWPERVTRLDWFSGNSAVVVPFLALALVLLVRRRQVGNNRQQRTARRKVGMAPKN